MSFGVWRSSTTFTVCLKPAAVSSRHWCVFHVWGGSQSPSSCHGALKLFFMLFKMFDHLIHTDILSYKSWWGFIAGTLNEMTGWRLNHLWGLQLNSFQVDIDSSVAPLANLRSIRCRCEAVAPWRQGVSGLVAGFHCKHRLPPRFLSDVSDMTVTSCEVTQVWTSLIFIKTKDKKIIMNQRAML